MSQSSIEQSPEFYTALLDALPLTLAVIDTEGVIVKTNGSWKQFGLNNDIDPSYLESGVNYLEICRSGSDDFGQRAYEGLREILEGNRDELTLEYPCHSEDEERWFLMKARPLNFDPTDHVLIVHLDITQRVKSERKLRHKEKLASIGEMSAGIMHEINNPNSFIEGNVEYLLKRLEGLPDPDNSPEAMEECKDFLEELEPILEEVKSGSNRITRVVNKVEGFSRKHSAEESETALPEVADVIARTVEQVESDRGIDYLHYEGVSGEINSSQSILLSEDELRSVLSNLLNNAVTAVEDASVESPAVYLKVDIEGTKLRLWVMDNGVGIDGDALSKVKDPFFTTKSISEGTGLGLSIVSNLVNKVDGDFELVSQPSEGTWAIVTIPLTSSS